jgi:hypothetical protein
VQEGLPNAEALKELMSWTLGKEVVSKKRRSPAELEGGKGLMSGKRKKEIGPTIDSSLDLRTVEDEGITSNNPKEGVSRRAKRRKQSGEDAQEKECRAVVPTGRRVRTGPVQPSSSIMAEVVETKKLVKLVC